MNGLEMCFQEHMVLKSWVRLGEITYSVSMEREKVWRLKTGMLPCLDVREEPAGVSQKEQPVRQEEN